jgi:XTP/dITP diphosphohydrolase
MLTVLVGSNNVHKTAELRTILEARHLARILTPSDVPSFPNNIPETGSTIEENAFIKASTIAGIVLHRPAGLVHACLADDTGLEVDALGGAPGVYSARYAGAEANDAANNTTNDAANRAKLLAALKGTPPNARTARFRTVICYIDELRTLFAEGVCEGTIATEERGNAGFGYDALFVPKGFTQTFAELAPEVKNAISHRGKAVEQLVTMLSGLQE